MLRVRTRLCPKSHEFVAEPGVVNAIKSRVAADVRRCRGGGQEHSRKELDLSISVSTFFSPLGRFVSFDHSPHSGGLGASRNSTVPSCYAVTEVSMIALWWL